MRSNRALPTNSGAFRMPAGLIHDTYSFDSSVVFIPRRALAATECRS